VLRLAVSAVFVMSALAWTPGHVQTAQAAPQCPVAPHHAEVVVEHASGATVSACVGFAGGTISGEELVRQSGIEYDMQQYGGYGEAVCQLDYEPATVDPNNCLGTSAYWALYVSRGCGAWQYAGAGVSSEQFADGDLEGFHYVSSSSGSPPPGPGGYCPPVATPTPVPAPTPTAATAPPSTPPPAGSSASRSGSAPTASAASGSARGAPASVSGTAGASSQSIGASPSSSTIPTGAVAALPPSDAAAPSQSEATSAAGALRRTGGAPPAPSSGAPFWGWVMGAAVAGGLVTLLAIRTRRRRA
jgi:hypothetical protein